MHTDSRRQPRRARSPSAATDGPVAREDLPYPVVHYPRKGVFLGFAPDEGAPPVLCACAQPGVIHAALLGGQGTGRGPLLDGSLLPDALRERLDAHPRDPASALPFVRGLCHRCNLAVPTLTYCHEVEGGRFIQFYGWYVAQTYYRLGIEPETLRYLPDVVPAELSVYLEEVERTGQVLQDSLGDEGSAPLPLGANARRLAERQYTARWHRRARASLDRAIESLARQEFGFDPVGEGWISERMLHRIACRLYGEERVLHRQRPDWLGGLELDLYVPERALAFEYQGQQHFHPVSAWGGAEGLEATRARDARKAAVCLAHGVTLIAVDYTEPLTETYVAERVRMAEAERKPQTGGRGGAADGPEGDG